MNNGLIRFILVRFFVAFGFILFFITGFCIGLSYQLTTSQAEIEEELKALYGAVAENNVTQNNIFDHHGRLLHYISGHQSSTFHKFCPECGLLEQIQIRKHEIDNEIKSISEQLTQNPKDAKLVEKLKLLNEEANTINRYVFRADEKAKALSSVIEVKDNKR